MSINPYEPPSDQPLRPDRQVLTQSELATLKPILTDARKILFLQIASFLIPILAIAVVPAAILRLCQAYLAKRRFPDRNKDEGYRRLAGETGLTLEFAIKRYWIVALLWPGIVSLFALAIFSR